MTPHNNGKPWTPEEDAYVRENYPRQEPSRTAAELGRTVKSVKLRAELLGVAVPGGRRHRGRKHPWRRYKQPPEGP